MVGCKVVVGLAAGALFVSFASFSSAARADTAAPKPAAPVSGPSAADLSAAKKNYADGEKKYKAGDFEGALAAFKSANDVKATPQAERYLGLCEDALGHYGAAVDWYDKFLAHVPDKMAAAADDLKKREADIKAMPGKVHVDSTPPGASVVIDDKPANGVTPIDVELPAGSHKMTLSAPDRLPLDKQVDVAFASTQTVTVELQPAPPPPAPPPSPVVAAAPPPAPAPAAPLPPASPLPAYITGGIAVAAVGVGTVFGIMALNDKSDFDKNPTSGTADDGDTHSLIADMAFGIGLTFGVTSAVLFLTKDEVAAGTTSSAANRVQSASGTPAKPAKGTTTHLPRFIPSPMIGPHVGGARFTWSF
jgi:hypothetical protein